MIDKIVFTILMPCLNEEKTIAFCISEAKKFIEESKVNAEILVVDNGSTDESAKIAAEQGVRVITEAKQGYGYAIRAGILAARGKYIVMADCDGSYDFYQISPFLEKLKAGYALVIGNRFCGQMEKNAMPFLHQYVGVPGLSWIARKCFHIPEIQDFHCGQRGFCRETAMKLSFQTDGMEFATEMIVEFAASGARICEIPVRLRRDKRDGPSHLRTVRDGFRHLNYIMKTYCRNQRKNS